MASEGEFPAGAILAALLVALALLAVALGGVDVSLAARVLSAFAAAGALAASVVSARVLVKRGFLLDPLAGTALAYAVPGFALASIGWALDAGGVEASLGPITLSKLAWYSASLLVMLAQWELSRAARALAGITRAEVALALGLPLAYGIPLALILLRRAALIEAAEAAASSLFLILSLLALLPIRRRRYSWGLTLMTAGSAAFVTAVPLAGLVHPYPPLANALYALSFVLAAAGIYVYGEEPVFLR